MRRRALLLAGAVLLLATFTAPALAKGAPRVLLASCTFYDLEYQPSSWSPGCTGGSYFLQNLVWSGWGTETANASGQVSLNDCEPSCAEGTAHVYPAQMSAYRIRTCRKGGRSHRQYTQVFFSWEYPPDNPFGEPAGPGSFGPWRVGSSDCRRQGEPFHNNRRQADEIATAAANRALSRKDWDIYAEGSTTRASKCHRIGRTRFACQVFARASDLHGYYWWRGRMRVSIGNRKVSWHWQGWRRKCSSISTCGPGPFDWRGKIGPAGVSLYN